MARKEAILIFLLLQVSIVFATDLILEPEIISANVGDLVTIDVKLNNNESIYGVDFKLNDLNGLDLLSYDFLSRTNNSMTSVFEQNSHTRFGILFSPNTTGIIPGDDSIIRLTYNATSSITGELEFSSVFLSDENGQEIQTTTSGNDIFITQPSAHLSCSNKIVYEGETVIIKIYAQTNNAGVGGIDFYQDYDSRVNYLTASTTSATSGAMLAEYPSTGKIRFALANMNITGTTHILDVEYDVIGSPGISVLSFKDISISDTDGELITTSSEDCEIEIEKTPTYGGNTGSGGGGGGGSSNTNQETTQQNTETPGNTQDYYSSLMGDEGSKDEINEPVFTTQEQEIREESETTEVKEETSSKKTKTKSLPLALISLTALIGLGVVLIFQIKR